MIKHVTATLQQSVNSDRTQRILDHVLEPSRGDQGIN